MTELLAIDPGNTQSAWAVIDARTCRPLNVGKADNAWVRGFLTIQVTNWPPVSTVAIERVASYGMTVGADVFETCEEVGSFRQIVRQETRSEALLVYRREVKLHHCASPRANDANITQALIDRFAHGQPNRGKGTKKQPGWFHGFSADIWQAYALAVYIADTHTKEAVA